MQKYRKKRICSLKTQQSLRGHVAIKKSPSYTAYPAFLGRRLNHDTTAEWLTSGTENECTVESNQASGGRWNAKHQHVYLNHFFRPWRVQ